MPVPADDSVIVHLDAESGRDLDHLFGHLHIGPRRVRVSCAMVVDQNDRGGRKLQGAFDDLVQCI